MSIENTHKANKAIALMNEINKYYNIETECNEVPLMLWLKENHKDIADEYVVYVRNECLKATEKLLKG